MPIFIPVDKTTRLTLQPHSFWTLWKVENEERVKGRMAPPSNRPVRSV